MGLIKRRPDINLLVEREMRTGGSYQATVVVNAVREVPIEWLRIELRGTEQGTVGSGDSQTTKKWQFLGLQAELSGPRTIPVGRTEFPVRFDIPAALPASYRGQRARVEYTAHLHASIDWWPDVRESFEVHVSGPWVPPPEDKPLLFSSNPEGPSSREPHVEGSLASAVYDQGSVVNGALALGNVRWNDYRALDVGLVAVETITLPNHRPAEHDLSRYAIQLPVDHPQEGASIPIRFRLPDSVPVTYLSTLWKLDWFFEVRAKIRWTADMHLRVPVSVFTPAGDSSSSHRVHQAPPSVGSERIERIWREVAEELSLDFDGRALSGRRGGGRFEVWREHRGGQGVFMVGRVDFSSLQLHLKVDPHGNALLRHLRRGLPFVNEQWDRSHLVTGRDAAQVAAIGAALGEVLTRFDATHLEDDHALIESQGAGQTHQELLAFCRSVMLLLPLIENVRGELPPPTSMAEGIEAWRNLAAQLHAPLETARMAVTGELDGMAAEVITEWAPEGQPLQTRLAISPMVPVSSQYQVRLTQDSEGKIDPSAWVLPTGAVRDLAQEILSDARAFELSEQQIRLILSAPILDPTPLISRLRSLARLTVLLRPGAGPFR